MLFKLHPQLQADCHTLGLHGDCTLLLHKNALLPWFILVPHSQHNELFKLDATQQASVQSSINQLARFIEQHFKSDKLNIASIGNIVPQLHIHVIGRFFNDFCWPQPVWGQQDSSAYSAEQITSLKQALTTKLPNIELSH